jgi:hypothetical protein
MKSPSLVTDDLDGSRGSKTGVFQRNRYLRSDPDAPGVLFLFSKHIPFIGHLPGDFYFDGGNVRIAFPLMTCIILSILLSMVIRLFGFGGK